MSILIKGMAMPERCIYCELCSIKVIGHHTASIICKHNGEEIALHGRREDCPLIELPPHGRLIDADALIKQMTEEGWAYGCGWADALDIALAPTIIESEGEE